MYQLTGARPANASLCVGVITWSRVAKGIDCSGSGSWFSATLGSALAPWRPFRAFLAVMGFAFQHVMPLACARSQRNMHYLSIYLSVSVLPSIHILYMPIYWLFAIGYANTYKYMYQYEQIGYTNIFISTHTYFCARVQYEHTFINTKLHANI